MGDHRKIERVHLWVHFECELQSSCELSNFLTSNLRILDLWQVFSRKCTVFLYLSLVSIFRAPLDRCQSAMNKWAPLPPRIMANRNDNSATFGLFSEIYCFKVSGIEDWILMKTPEHSRTSRFPPIYSPFARKSFCHHRLTHIHIHVHKNR